MIGGFTIYRRGLQGGGDWIWARRFMELHLKHYPGWEGEVEVRQMYEEPSAD